MSRDSELTPSSPFPVATKRRTWCTALYRSGRRYEYIYLWSCCVCKESSFLGWCNRNANVPTGGYLVPFSRPT